MNLESQAELFDFDPNLAIVLDAMAWSHGVELRLDYDEDAPLLFAVWATCPEVDDPEPEIIGAGDNVAAALADARWQLRRWEGR